MNGDEIAARELVLYIENTSDLSPDGPRGQGRSIFENLIKKIWAGTYQSARVPAAFKHLTDAAAKRYEKEMGGSFDAATRRIAAQMLADSFQDRLVAGYYDEEHLRADRVKNGATLRAYVVPRTLLKGGWILGTGGMRLPASVPKSAKTPKQALDAIEKQWRKGGGGKPAKKALAKKAPAKKGATKPQPGRQTYWFNRIVDDATDAELPNVLDKARTVGLNEKLIESALTKRKAATAKRTRLSDGLTVKEATERTRLLRELTKALAEHHASERGGYSEKAGKIMDRLSELKASQSAIDQAYSAGLAEARRLQAEKKAPAKKPKAPSKKPQPESGYAYKGDDDVTGGNWRHVSDESWEIVMLSPERATKIEHLGTREIDGVRVNVWRMHDPMVSGPSYYAQQKRGR